MGNTLGLKGFPIGSSRQVSSSKHPKSSSIKLTSQIQSLTWRTPTSWPANTVLTLIFRRFQQIRPPRMRWADRPPDEKPSGGTNGLPPRGLHLPAEGRSRRS
jgi:hypothetical protein